MSVIVVISGARKQLVAMAARHPRRQLTTNICNVSPFKLHVVVKETTDGQELNVILDEARDPCWSDNLFTARHFAVQTPPAAEYVSVTIAAIDADDVTIKEASFFTSVRHSWIVSDAEIRRHKVGEDNLLVADQHDDDETEAHFRSSVSVGSGSSYKWDNRDVIKQYDWTVNPSVCVYVDCESDGSPDRFEFMRQLHRRASISNCTDEQTEEPAARNASAKEGDPEIRRIGEQVKDADITSVCEQAGETTVSAVDAQINDAEIGNVDKQTKDADEFIQVHTSRGVYRQVRAVDLRGNVDNQANDAEFIHVHTARTVYRQPRQPSIVGAVWPVQPVAAVVAHTVCIFNDSPFYLDIYLKDADGTRRGWNDPERMDRSVEFRTEHEHVLIAVYVTDSVGRRLKCVLFRARSSDSWIVDDLRVVRRQPGAARYVAVPFDNYPGPYETNWSEGSRWVFSPLYGCTQNVVKTRVVSDEERKREAALADCVFDDRCGDARYAPVIFPFLIEF